MSKDLIIKKCNKCNAQIEIIKECKCDKNFKCCEEEMVTLIPNSSGANEAKHMPIIEVKDNNILVKVNHGMNPDHYIEWLAFVCEECGTIEKKILKPNEPAERTFPYKKGAKVYAYCTKDGLWRKEIE